ncbi:MAG: phospholipase D-like domain-containing protein [Halodesulfurarchaeum sp.]
MLAKGILGLLLLTNATAAIDGVYPNPATAMDRGEFVILHNPDGNWTGYELSDNQTTVSLETLNTSGRVAVTDDPGPASNLTSLPVRELDSFLQLSNGGETVTLRNDSHTVSAVSYGQAPSGKLYRNGTFQPIGRTDLPVLARQDLPVTVTTLPDDPGPIYETIDGAESRLLLAGYTLTDPRLVRTLLEAHRGGVSVAVLVEGAPVGGIPGEQVSALDTLRKAEVPVHVMGTEHARYRFHHAKYAVVDDRVVVTSENWKPGGTGGNGSRGWGAVIHSESMADELSSVFRADTDYVDTVSWEDRSSEATDPEPLDNASYPQRFGATESRAERVSLIVAPDNAERRVTDLIEDAEDSILIQQVSIDESSQVFQSAIRAADRGVEVQILLSGEWYARAENQALAAKLRRQADRSDRQISVRLAEPRSRYEHVHNKGVIVDGESVLVGSLNWNPTALQENREVSVLIEDEATAEYFQRVFRADWRGAAWRVPWVTLAGTALAVVAAIRYSRSIARFESS